MRIFTLDKMYNVVCNWENTRYGFRHIAVLHKNGFEVCRAKACYYNRTWERFEYETVLKGVVNKYFNDTEKTKYLTVIAGANGF